MEKSAVTIFSLTDNGKTIGKRIQQILPHASRLHQPAHFKVSVQNAFHHGDCLIFICATGIVIRTLAPLLRNKKTDPAVVVIDDKGKFVIPLLGGHEGGGGVIARKLADFLDAQCVVTSATDYGYPVYVVGMGCDRHCPENVLADLLKEIEPQLCGINLESIASIDIKSQEPGLIALANSMGIPLLTYPAEMLRSVEHQLSVKSEIVFNAVGCYGVAEGAALVRAQQISGIAGELVVSKIKNQRATAAVARSWVQHS